MRARPMRAAASSPDGRRHASSAKSCSTSGVTIYSDPDDPVAPEPVYGDGRPAAEADRLGRERASSENLVYSRFWAQEKGREPVPGPQTLIMRGRHDIASTR